MCNGSITQRGYFNVCICPLCMQYTLGVMDDNCSFACKIGNAVVLAIDVAGISEEVFGVCT